MPLFDETLEAEGTDLVPAKSVGQNIAHMLTLRELENYYKNNALAYAKNIQDFTLEIEQLKSQIAQIKKEKEAQEMHIVVVHNDLHHYKMLLQRLNESFSGEVKSMEDLHVDYKQSVQKQEYEALFLKKKELVTAILDDIEEQENILLNKELERLNILVELEPKRSKVQSLEEQLHTLELNKQHYESTLLQQLTQTSKNTDTKEIVETVIMDEKT